MHTSWEFLTDKEAKGIMEISQHDNFVGVMEKQEYYLRR